jgi:hypothetical protein
VHRVVTRRLQKRNNDVAIAFIHQLPQGYSWYSSRIPKCADENAVPIYSAMPIWSSLCHFRSHVTQGLLDQ